MPFKHHSLSRPTLHKPKSVSPQRKSIIESMRLAMRSKGLSIQIIHPKQNPETHVTAIIPLTLQKITNMSLLFLKNPNLAMLVDHNAF